MILGITGGTGCGKTTLLKLIEEQGGLILDCDAIYHRLLVSDAQLLETIENAFPGTVEKGALDRKKLGTVVFAEPQALQKLNGITHGAVKEEVLRRLKTEPKLAAIDAIGLIESGLNDLCDVTVAVTAPEENRVQRLMDRDGISQEYAMSRIRAQHSDNWFRQQCDHVLDNGGTPQQFHEKCIAFLTELGIMKENQ